MFKKIFVFTISLVSKITRKKILYFSGTKSEWLAAVKSRYNFWYYGNIADQSDIVYGIAVNGTVEEFDTEVVRTILKNIHPNFVFYDIGSNTGWYTMIAATASEVSKVFSFEPIHEHIKFQKETIYLNRKENQVTIFELALSDHNGQETIRLGGSGTSLDKDFLEKDFGTRVITVQTLDSLVKANNLLPPDFIKMDVEGHEYKVLLGAQKILTQSKPVLFIEVAKTLNNKRFLHKDFNAIFSNLASLHYTPYIARNGTLAQFDISEEVDGVHMFLFLHNESHRTNKKLVHDLHIA